MVPLLKIIRWCVVLEDRARWVLWITKHNTSLKAKNIYLFTFFWTLSENKNLGTKTQKTFFKCIFLPEIYIKIFRTRYFMKTSYTIQPSKKNNEIVNFRHAPRKQSSLTCPFFSRKHTNKRPSRLNILINARVFIQSITVSCILTISLDIIIVLNFEFHE